MKILSWSAFAVLGSLLVVACATFYGDRVSFTGFQAKAKSFAGAGAVDCGHVALGASRSAINCCVATNFARSRPFSATYEEQGIDSRVAKGIALDGGSATMIFLFDGNLGGGRQDNGVVYSHVCNRPTLIANPCTDPVRFPVVCK